MARPVRSPRRKTPPSSSSSSPTTYVVAGARTPFLKSGTDYVDTLAYELGVFAVKGLLEKTDLDPASVERLSMGCVLSEPRTTNVAREIVLAAGLPLSVPASTVTAACISANVAIASVHEAIAAGSLGVAIAGGVETLSDVPIRYQRSVRKRLIASQKAKSPVDYMKLLTGLKPQDLLPETPAIAEFSTGQTMGESAERLAKRLGISREAQDAFAAASHQQAHAAHEKGRYAEQIVPVRVAPKFGELTRDNGVRGDTTPEKLAGLSPAFDKRFGSVTAGNSSFLTDGAAACLLASGARVKALGLTPLARIVATAWVAIDPVEELLLGPAYAVPAALERAGLTLDDIGVWEIHEAFAVPVLAALQLLADSAFCKEKLGLSRALGEIDPAKVNRWGGSLSVGHPFGATGARLVMTCAERLVAERKRYGLVTACAAGAMGHAIVLERA